MHVGPYGPLKNTTVRRIVDNGVAGAVGPSAPASSPGFESVEIGEAEREVARWRGTGNKMVGASGQRKRDEQDAQVEEIVQSLLHEDNLPKAERIRLMKELVRRGDDMPDEALELALKRLLERILF